MGEYRVMREGATYLIQQKEGNDWETLGEFDNINSAKKMVRELRGEKK